MQCAILLCCSFSFLFCAILFSWESKGASSFCVIEFAFQDFIRLNIKPLVWALENRQEDVGNGQLVFL